jgi:hypothetical protein
MGRAIDLLFLGRFLSDNLGSLTTFPVRADS